MLFDLQGGDGDRCDCFGAEVNNPTGCNEKIWNHVQYVRVLIKKEIS